MLRKSRRLNSGEVSAVLRSGKPRRGVYLYMKFLELQVPRKISAVVAKSVARKAVDRNRLRRAVYRALNSPACQQLCLSGVGHAVVFVQKVPKSDVSALFAEDLKTLFKNSKT